MYKFILLMMVAICMGGCASNPKQSETRGVKATENLEAMQQSHSPDEGVAEKNSDILQAVDKVLSQIQNAKTNMETRANAKALNSVGQHMQEDWDVIEKKVEKKYPADYKNIEESLYPLISELKKDDLDLANIRKLSDQTKDKLDLFKLKLRQ
jgi:hypothetical protein